MRTEDKIAQLLIADKAYILELYVNRSIRLKKSGSDARFQAYQRLVSLKLASCNSYRKFVTFSCTKELDSFIKGLQLVVHNETFLTCHEWCFGCHFIWRKAKLSPVVDEIVLFLHSRMCEIYV